MSGFPKNAWIILTIYFFRTVARVPAFCVSNYKLKDWKFVNHLPPPATLTQNLTISRQYGNQTIIEVWLKDRHEDFNFTLFADPFVKNESDCPRHLQEHKNLRQFFNTCPILRGADDSKPQLFGSIFTGCYYFVMTNEEGKNWHHVPLFYNTSYRFLNTKLELGQKYDFIPEETDSTMKLGVVLKVPLSCIQVKARLFQHKAGTENALDMIKEGGVPESLKCFFNMSGHKIKPQCETAALSTNLTLVIYAEKKDDGWEGRLVWKNLRYGGGKYYVHFIGNPKASCTDIYGDGNISTWRPIQGEIWEDLGHVNATNVPRDNSVNSIDRSWFSIGCLIAGVVVFAILCYQAWKHREIILDIFRQRKELSPGLEPVESPAGCKESDQILLLYESGSPEFMKEMSNFRNYLRQHCGKCNVHDIYAINEWNRVNKLGAPGWVQELLKDGSKVVWVDTPQFRSRMNDKDKQYSVEDFRDNAIPYAVCVATDSFQNAVTQYRRHFIVRLRSFEVQDGEDDPLQVVSPYVRYYIPEHLSLLCQDLRGSLEPLEHKENAKKSHSQKNIAG